MALRFGWLLLSAIHLAVFLPLSLVVWAPSIVCAVLRAVLAKLGCLPTTVATTSTSAAERRTAQSSRATSHLPFAQPTLPAESLTRPRLFFDGMQTVLEFLLADTPELPHATSHTITLTRPRRIHLSTLRRHGTHVSILSRSDIAHHSAVQTRPQCVPFRYKWREFWCSVLAASKRP